MSVGPSVLPYRRNLPQRPRQLDVSELRNALSWAERTLYVSGMRYVDQQSQYLYVQRLWFLQDGLLLVSKVRGSPWRVCPGQMPLTRRHDNLANRYDWPRYKAVQGATLGFKDEFGVEEALWLAV
jgi:hypothetical protein